MANALRSNWTVQQVLAALPDVRRVDDGSDLLAFRVAGDNPVRTVYVYLYGDDPDVIWYDIEDETIETKTWDHRIRSGGTRSITELQEVVVGWLNGKA